MCGSVRRGYLTGWAEGGVGKDLKLTLIIIIFIYTRYIILWIILAVFTPVMCWWTATDLWINVLVQY